MIITDTSGRSIELIIAQGYWCFRDANTGKEIINFNPANELEMLQETFKQNPGILRMLNKDIESVYDNLKVYQDMADTILAYHASANYIGNQQGVDEIIHNAKAKLK